MTLTFCDVCGVEINLDALPKPTHYSLSLTHYDTMTAWEARGPHWTHLCLECTAMVRPMLEKFAESRSVRERASA